MDDKDAPKDPANAETDPPPGAGLFEDNSSTKPLVVQDISFPADLPTAYSIIFSFISDESGYLEKDISDSKGMFNCNIQTFKILKNFYKINAAVDLTQFTGSDNIGKYLLSEFKNILVPNITFDIEILPINIYLNIDEKSFGNSTFRRKCAFGATIFTVPVITAFVFLNGVFIDERSPAS